MKTAKINLDGKEYLLCFSTRVVKKCAERYGGVEKIDEALGSEDAVQALDESLWILAAMLDAGARYAKLNGMENPAPPDQESLYDLCDVSDFAGLKGKIMETITAGKAHQVEAAPGKNAAATQAKETAEVPLDLSGTSGTD